MEDLLVSHSDHDAVSYAILHERLESQPDLQFSLEDTQALLKELTTFELGRFLLQHRGLNGLWTAYWIWDAPNLTLTNTLEAWFVHKAPVVLATRERATIFQELAQKYLSGRQRLASVPCGRMDDLLRLTYPKPVALYGIDLDPEALQLAEHYARSRDLLRYCTFFHRNAWDLQLTNTFDVMLSNGLNIYVSEPEKITLLFEQMYQALQKGGVLITSFLTPKSEWVGVNHEDLTLEVAIFRDILQVRWSNECTEQAMREILQKIGFSVEEVRYDRQRRFPSIVAVKC